MEKNSNPNKEKELNKLLDIAQAADEIGISVSTLREHLIKGGLPHYRITRRIRIKKADLLAYIERFRVEAVTRPANGKITIKGK